MVAEGIIPNQPLTKLYKDRDWQLYMDNDKEQLFISVSAEVAYRWISSLGHTYAALVVDEVIPRLPLAPLLDDSSNEELIQSPASGISLWFRADTKRFEKIMFTLIATVGQPIYQGPLPPRFAHRDKAAVRSALGEPETSRPPIKLPGGLGARGGSDTYSLKTVNHPGINVTFSYLENLNVNNISFFTVDKAHE